MRIGIDAHFVGVRYGGNEQHFENLISHLPTAAPDGDEFFVFNYRLAARERLRGDRLRLIPLRSRSVYWQRGVEIPLQAQRLRLDVLHVPFNYLPVSKYKKIVTVHDLAFLHYPQLYAPVERLRMRLLTRLAAGLANHIFTVSETVKQDIIERYGVDPARITITPNAVDRDVFRPLGEDARDAVRRLGVDVEYFLYVGTLRRHKNLPSLIDAYARLRERGRCDHHLVLVGRPDRSSAEVFRLVRERGLDDVVHHLGEMAPAALVGLYSAATALVMPSLYESFGMPLLEAMSCGCPVVCSNAAALPEVYGDAALPFDPRCPEELAVQLERVLEDAGLRQDLVRRGFGNCERFSWARTAALVHAAYHEA